METNKIYYAKGDELRSSEIEKMFTDKGMSRSGCMLTDPDAYYYNDRNGVIHITKVDNCKRLLEKIGEQLQLPDPEVWKPKYKIGDHVMYRQFNEDLVSAVVKDYIYSEHIYIIRIMHSSNTKKCTEGYLSDMKYPDEDVCTIKVGDRITLRENGNERKCVISDINRDGDSVNVSVYIPYDMKSDVNDGYTPVRGDVVLVRNDSKSPWQEAVMSYYKYDNARKSMIYRTVGGGVWNQCVKFDIDKLGSI